jgi:hypothetical protein|tara:strand:- start:39 stop:371 length:333 start_codon:yes stop_codon:yes gene_type:complete
VCVLLLRGPRTPGELRSNSRRLHTFEDNRAVEEVLRELIKRKLVVQLPHPGSAPSPVHASAECGEIETAPVPRTDRPQPPRAEPSANSDLEARVAALEAEVTPLKRALDL